MSDKPQRVVEAAISQLGSPYVFGAWGEFCTPANRGRRQRSDHPTIRSKCQVLNGTKADCEGCKWQGDRMFDCRGFTYWCLQQIDIMLRGQGATAQYSNSANWLEKGLIKDMPECVCCVFIANGNKKEHTGLYIGNSEIIECSTGVIRSSLSSRWTHYGIPRGLYTAAEIAEIRGKEQKPKRVLRKGDNGNDVRELQEILTGKGFDCGYADGVFGARTLDAVKRFQEFCGLDPDGIVGKNTWAALYQDVQPERKTYTVSISGLTDKQLAEVLERYPDAKWSPE